MNTEVPLYPDGKVPFSLGTGPDDTPTLTLYPAEKPNGAAVVVCPGGGYGGLAGHEGEPIRTPRERRPKHHAGGPRLKVDLRLARSHQQP